MARITSFRELRVFRLAFDLAMEIYRVTKGFPAAERFGLVSQARRSSRSVCANIGEAWRRRRYPAAFVAKLTDAEAEATETRIHLDFALACGHLDRREHEDLDRRYDALIGKLVRMIDSADTWAVGRSTARPSSSAVSRKVKRTRTPEPAETPSPPRRGSPDGRVGPGTSAPPGTTPTSLEGPEASDPPAPECPP